MKDHTKGTHLKSVNNEQRITGIATRWYARRHVVLSSLIKPCQNKTDNCSSYNGVCYAKGQEHKQHNDRKRQARAPLIRSWGCQAGWWLRRRRAFGWGWRRRVRLDSMTRRRKREIEESVDTAEEEEGYMEDQGPIQRETEDIWARIVSSCFSVCAALLPFGLYK